MHATTGTDPVLQVRDLVVEFSTPTGPARAVDGISFDVFPDEVLGVVGESGSGKSVTMLAVMGLLPPGRARVTAGQVLFNGEDLLTAPEPRMRALRGGQLSMIFQDPMTSLNPVLRVGGQIAEIVRLHRPGLTRGQVRERVLELLTLVGVPDPARRYRQYPHEWSGGMRQRAMIAMAIANEPALLIADEPTTALDVTIQAQVLEVLAAVRQRTGTSMVLITHDLGLVAETADRVAVTYAGRIVELTGVDTIFGGPRHPYTVGLLASLPRLDTPVEDLASIQGQPPGLDARPRDGCVFRPRCGLGLDRERCAQEVPLLAPVDQRPALDWPAGDADRNPEVSPAAHPDLDSGVSRPGQRPARDRPGSDNWTADDADRNSTVSLDVHQLSGSGSRAGHSDSNPKVSLPVQPHHAACHFTGEVATWAVRQHAPVSHGAGEVR